MIGKTISSYKILANLRDDPRFGEVLKKQTRLRRDLGKYLSQQLNRNLKLLK